MKFLEFLNEGKNGKDESLSLSDIESILRKNKAKLSKIVDALKCTYDDCEGMSDKDFIKNVVKSLRSIGAEELADSINTMKDLDSLEFFLNIDDIYSMANKMHYHQRLDPFVTRITDYLNEGITSYKELPNSWKKVTSKQFSNVGEGSIVKPLVNKKLQSVSVLRTQLLNSLSYLGDDFILGDKLINQYEAILFEVNDIPVAVIKRSYKGKYQIYDLEGNDRVNMRRRAYKGRSFSKTDVVGEVITMAEIALGNLDMRDVVNQTKVTISALQSDFDKATMNKAK